MNGRDHYATLSIDRCASCAEIKRAYRVLARRFHPDVSDDRDGERKFKDVAEAYRTLKQPASRTDYDRQIHNVCDGRSQLLSGGLPESDVFALGWIILRYWSAFWTTRQSGEREH